MRKVFLAPALTAILAAGLAFLAHAVVNVNVKEDFVYSTTIPCTGDQIVLEGRTHILATWTEDGNGGEHVKAKFQPQKLQGIVISGPNMGAKYNGNGLAQDSLNLKKGETYTFVHNYLLIGQGRAPNLKVQDVWHITVNANGELTVDFIRGKVTCK